MAGVPDAFTVVQAANPVGDKEAAEACTTSALEMALERVLSSPRRARWWDRLRDPAAAAARRRRSSVGVAGAAMVGLAWTVYVASDHAPSSLTIGCYAAADLNSQTVVVANHGGPPAEVCGEVWQRGELGPGPVPVLVPCLLGAGVVGVFPEAAGDTCSGLGATPLGGLPATTVAPEQEPIALRDALSDAFAQPCIDEQGAVQLVNRELAVRRLADWAVEVIGPFTGERPCASVGVDPPAKRVLLIARPRS